jgi:DNA replication licensing factor MCM6
VCVCVCVCVNDSYEPFLRKGVQNFVKRLHPSFVTDDNPDRGDKEFYVAFFNMQEVSKLRELKTGRLGQLISMQGTVTRTSEVLRPG